MRKGAQCQHGLQKARAGKLLRVQMSIALAATNGPIVGRSGCELQIYNMPSAATIGAHGVCGITGGSEAKFQGVPGGSGGFRRHFLNHRTRKLLVLWPSGGGSSARAKQFKIKKRERSHSHDHEGPVGTGDGF